MSASFELGEGNFRSNPVAVGTLLLSAVGFTQLFSSANSSASAEDNARLGAWAANAQRACDDLYVSNLPDNPGINEARSMCRCYLKHCLASSTVLTVSEARRRERTCGSISVRAHRAVSPDISTVYTESSVCADSK